MAAEPGASATNDLTRVAKALADAGFLFSAADFDERLRSQDHTSSDELVSKVLKWSDIVTKLAVPVIETPPGLKDLQQFINIKPSMAPLAFEEDHLQRSLVGLGKGLDLVAFRYVLSQPTFVGIKFAGSLTPIQRASTFQAFDQQILECHSLTASMKVSFARISMSVVGLLLWLFEESDAAARFNATEKGKLRQSHLMKKTYTLSWAVDLQSDKVTRHNGLPILVSEIFDVNKFESGLKSAR